MRWHCIRQGKGGEAQLNNFFQPMSLEIKNLHARVTATGTEILRGLDLTVEKGRVHAIMGPNGSGKSTLSKVLGGHPDYEVTGGDVFLDGVNILDLEPYSRSPTALFL